MRPRRDGRIRPPNRANRGSGRHLALNGRERVRELCYSFVLMEIAPNAAPEAGKPAVVFYCPVCATEVSDPLTLFATFKSSVKGAVLYESDLADKPESLHKLNALTPLFRFEPGRIYHIQGGSIDGHCFVFVDGRLAIELTDPDPIDSSRYVKIGFEAYCSHIQIRNVKIWRLAWEAVEASYIPEFR